MIVTCPNCSSRYRIDPSKIRGRGAKITCPTCAHKFVVYREDGAEAGAPGSAATATPAPIKNTRGVDTGTAPSAPPRPTSGPSLATKPAFSMPGGAASVTAAPPTHGTPVGASPRMGPGPVIPAPRPEASSKPATTLARNNIPGQTPTPVKRALSTPTPPTTDSVDVHRPSRFGVPADIARRDFRKFGLTWKVRKGIGLTYDFHDLSTLREYMDDGQVGSRDVLSYDARDWKLISDIPSLEVYFWEIWTKAKKGELTLPENLEEEEDEDESDAPTTIVGQGVSLADEIRRAVVLATTPAPAADRLRTPEIAPPAMMDTSGSRPLPLSLHPTSVRSPTPAATEPAPRRGAGDDPFKVLEKKPEDDTTNGVGFGLLVVILFLLAVIAFGVAWVIGWLG